MNLLITGAWQGAKENIAALEALGHSVVFLQFEKDPLPCGYGWVEGVVCNGLFLHHPIEKFTGLRYIQLTSAGYDRVPMDYVRGHGITIHNAAGVYSTPMAEFALCGVLELYKQSRFFLENQGLHRWEKHRGLLELAGKTVCILGCGGVGTACARRFSAMDCRVLGLDLTDEAKPYFDAVYSMARLGDVMPNADVVILCLPLTEDTAGLFSRDMLRKMKPGAILVNIARGALVDTGALIAALSGYLGGAVLDVFEEEPLREDSPLWDMDNVILTPHNSFVGDGNQERLFSTVIKNIQSWRSL